MLQAVREYNPGNQNAYASLIGCIQNTCVGGECFYPICDATIMQGGQPVALGFWFVNSCATYMGTHCCRELKTCLASPTCANCIVYGDSTACAQTALDDPITACQDLPVTGASTRASKGGRSHALRGHHRSRWALHGRRRSAASREVSWRQV